MKVQEAVGGHEYVEGRGEGGGGRQFWGYGDAE